MKFIARVTRDHQTGVIRLAAADAQSELTMDKLRVGSDYKVDARKARNPDHHRKGFALINLIHENQDRYGTLEDTLTELKLRTGWYREHLRASGEIIYIPKSISFADMDQTAFEEFYDRVLDLAINEFGLAEAVEFLGND